MDLTLRPAPDPGSLIPSLPASSPVPTGWRPGRALSLLLAWTALTTLVFWLPTVRGAMDGSTYAWGLLGLSGRGTGGDYWFPVTGSVLALLTFWLGWRGGRFPVHLLLVGWHGALAAGVALLALRDPGALRFQGDTLGMDVSLAGIVPVLMGGMALLAVGWALADLRARGIRAGARGVPAWGRRNTVLTMLAVALLPLQLVLLRTGVPHGGTDQVGVLLTLVQWGILAVAFRPGGGAGTKQWLSRESDGTRA
jgi:hypothetical protein